MKIIEIFRNESPSNDCVLIMTFWIERKLNSVHWHCYLICTCIGILTVDTQVWAYRVKNIIHSLIIFWRMTKLCPWKPLQTTSIGLLQKSSFPHRAISCNVVLRSLSVEALPKMINLGAFKLILLPKIFKLWEAHCSSILHRAISYKVVSRGTLWSSWGIS